MGRAQKLKQQRKEEQQSKKKEERKKVWRTVLVVSISVLAVAVTVFLVLLVNYMKKEEERKESEPSITQEMVLETTKGEIVIGLFGEDAPLTVQHVVDLVNQGYYDDLRWYRVEDFVVQTGSHVQSVLAEAGDSEPDQAKLDEALAQDQAVPNVPDEVGASLVRGVVSMAKQSDPQTQQYTPGSARTDFFILKSDRTDLDFDFTAFGKVVSGMDVVDSLETSDVLIKATIREK